MAEILAPAGSEESLLAALRTGCDAVYLGGDMFSARQNAGNFTRQTLAKAVADCHIRGVKVYQAINTVITDEQLDDCVSAVKFACEIGIDGLITQDLALIEIVKDCCLDMEIHASTQMTLHTERGVVFAKDLGFSRAVCARELPIEIIKKLCEKPIEIEIFVHGALCMSVSGQCFMSAMIGSRSANRGLCAQACRLPCTAIKGKERNDLSLKDMSYVSHLGELVGAGVASLKIEGRMKRPEYVAAAVDSCKKALDGEDYDSSLLEDVFSRNGFTDGYYNAKTGKIMFGTRQKEDVISSTKALPKIHELYRREYKRSEISIDVCMKAGEPIKIKATDGDISVSVKGEIPQIAQNRPSDEEYLKKQLSKLGDTIYSLGRFAADCDNGLAYPSGGLNLLRRELCERLNNARLAKNTKLVEFTDTDFEIATPARVQMPKMRISVTNPAQLERIVYEDIELVICPLAMVDSVIKTTCPLDKIAVEMPRFTFGEDRDFSLLKKAKAMGIAHIICTNFAHISMGKELEMEMHGGLGLNVTNSLALRALNGLWLNDCIASFELKSSQINALGDELDFGIIGYGRLPLMLTVNCPIKQAVGCKSCTGELWDRTNRRFPVKCSLKNSYVEILNSDVLYVGDRLGDFKSASFVQLDFYNETSAQVCDIITAVKNGANADLDGITRGLYYRGVI